MFESSIAFQYSLSSRKHYRKRIPKFRKLYFSFIIISYLKRPSRAKGFYSYLFNFFLSSSLSSCFFFIKCQYARVVQLFVNDVPSTAHHSLPKQDVTRWQLSSTLNPVRQTGTTSTFINAVCTIIKISININNCTQSHKIVPS